MHYYYMRSTLLYSFREKAKKYKDLSWLNFTQEMHLSGKLDKDIHNIKNFYLSKNTKFFDVDKKAE